MAQISQQHAVPLTCGSVGLIVFLLVVIGLLNSAANK
jgi:hypothetical protein